MERPKGTKDIFGQKQIIREYVVDVLEAIAKVYNYQKIETPIFEKYEVFSSAVGLDSDIVAKEMFLFDDKKGRKMTLRPEGTAGTIRAVVQNKLYASNDGLKLFYNGPMFRYESPQKGRQRQFTQFGIEMIGQKSPYADGEVILMADLILKTLNIPFTLKINSLGDSTSRARYNEALTKYFKKNIAKLSDLSQSRIQSNPLRILDDKVDREKDVVKNAPLISKYYSKESHNYFKELVTFLQMMNIDFEVDHRLVRGLDYYSETAFEFVSVIAKSQSQGTIVGGGRYQSLIKMFGGPDLGGVGFGLGIERIVNDFSETKYAKELQRKLEVFVLNTSDKHLAQKGAIVNLLRSSGISTEWNIAPLNIKKAFQKAAKQKPQLFVIIEDKDLTSGTVVVKSQNKQKQVRLEKLVETIKEELQNYEPKN